MNKTVAAIINTLARSGRHRGEKLSIADSVISVLHGNIGLCARDSQMQEEVAPFIRIDLVL
jgi:hypothetical protein